MTTSYEVLRTTLDALKDSALPAPKASFMFHDTSVPAARWVMAALPHLTWKAEGGAAGSVWVRGTCPGLEVVIHLTPLAPKRVEDPTLTAARALVAEATS